MKAVSATSASFHVNAGSDSEEEEVSPLVRRPRASRGDPALGAKGEHLKTPSQGSLPPKRPAPVTPAASGETSTSLSRRQSNTRGPTPVDMGIKTSMRRIKDTWLRRRHRQPAPVTGTTLAAPLATARMPTRPAPSLPPTRPAPAVPATSSPQPQPTVAGDSWLAEYLEKLELASQTEPLDLPLPARKLPAMPSSGAQAGGMPDSPPISPMPPLRRAATVDAEKSRPVLDEKSEVPTTQKPLSSPPLSPKVDAAPSRPVSPEAATPVVSQREGKQPMPPSPSALDEASTSAAAPADAGAASPIEAVPQPTQKERADQAEALAKDIEKLMSISFFRHGHATLREDLNYMHRLFERAKPFLGMEAELLQARAELQYVLAGDLSDLGGISRPRLRKLTTLGLADISGQFAELNWLKEDLADARQDIINGDGDPKWISQPLSSRQEIDDRHAADVAQQNAAIKAGYGIY